jgi:hypothetical protein
MEGSGTREAPRGWLILSDLPVEEEKRGSRVPGEALGWSA